MDILIIKVKQIGKYRLLPKNDWKIHEICSLMEWVSRVEDKVKWFYSHPIPQIPSYKVPVSLSPSLPLSTTFIHPYNKYLLSITMIWALL